MAPISHKIWPQTTSILRLLKSPKWGGGVPLNSPCDLHLASTKFSFLLSKFWYRYLSFVNNSLVSITVFENGMLGQTMFQTYNFFCWANFQDKSYERNWSWLVHERKKMFFILLFYFFYFFTFLLFCSMSFFRRIWIDPELKTLSLDK